MANHISGPAGCFPSVRARVTISPYVFANGQLIPSVQSCTQLVWPACGQLQQLPGRLNTQKLALPQPALAGQPSAGQAAFASFVPSMITTLSHSFAFAGSVNCLYFGVDHQGASPFGRRCIVAPLCPRLVTQYLPRHEKMPGQRKIAWTGTSQRGHLRGNGARNERGRSHS